ncbi:MAG: acyl-CoA synthetase [Cytophagales bacterium]|nr:acyl-CoA synthetase [Bernardetiaceae bacterium]MDW8209706.1 acyl-CoA synthetase [Cytophagales bacterium]
MEGVKFFQRLEQFSNRLALSDNAGSYTYLQLLQASKLVSSQLHQVEQQPICFLYPASFDYVAVLLGIWQAGGIAVPLSVVYPPAELAYILADTGCRQVWTAPQYEPTLRQAVVGLHATPEIVVQANFASQGENYLSANLLCISEDFPALMIYTSGTTGKPKGAVHTHKSLRAQMEILSSAWGWQPEDEIINPLPLHHIHGLINALACALWNGAHCILRPRFEALQTWEWFCTQRASIFMAVPTIYQRLIQYWEEQPLEVQQRYANGARKLRLMISGSAALPISVLQRWQEITGHFLLERYGMTETGMVLSNPLNGQRWAGFVGKPLPGVEVRLVDDDGKEQTAVEATGEIQVKSPMMFKFYWQRPEITAQSFTPDGWFRTGDIAYRNSNGNYKILGRVSSDILKISGYKVSALEIEETLMLHPQVKACAVVGIPHAEKGEQAAAFVVLSDGSSLEEIQKWLKTQLAHYKQPAVWQVVEELPRNAMGKVQKTALKTLLTD